MDRLTAGEFQRWKQFIAIEAEKNKRGSEGG